MTDTASRPDMTPAVATLTPPEDAEAVEPAVSSAATEELPVRSCRRTAPVGTGRASSIDAEIADPVDLSMSTARSPGGARILHRSTSRLPSLDPTEITGVAAIAVPEKPMPGMTSSLGPVGKHRSTFGVVALSIVTLGIYSLVWHNRVNREVGNFDPTRMHVSSPGRSTGRLGNWCNPVGAGLARQHIAGAARASCWPCSTSPCRSTRTSPCCRRLRAARQAPW